MFLNKSKIYFVIVMSATLFLSLYGIVAAQVETGTHKFYIGPEEEISFEFAVHSVGMITLIAEWGGPAEEAVLMLQDPAGEVYAQREGPSPLIIEFWITEELLERGIEWRAIFVNLGPGEAEGVLEITYPVPTEEEPFGELPDLVIEELIFSSERPYEGEEMMMVALVRNVSEAPVEGIPVIFLADEEHFLGEAGIEYLEPDQIEEVEIFVTAQDQGEQIVREIDDPENRIREVNEENNRMERVLIVMPPEYYPEEELSDLLIEELIFSSERPYEGEEMTLIALVRNVGEASIEGIPVIFLTDEEHFLGEASIGYLEPDQAEEVEITVTAQDPGEHIITALIDPENQIMELNEENNELTRDIAVLPGEFPEELPEELPDLMIEDIAFSPEQPYENEEAVITVIVKNLSAVPAEQILVIITDESTEFGYTALNHTVIEYIEPGEAEEVDFTARMRPAGEHIVTVLADPENVINESDEENNETSSTIDIIAREELVEEILLAEVPRELSTAGIYTFEELLPELRSKEDLDALSTETGLPKEELKELALKAELTNIEGLGPDEVEFLSEAGIESVTELASIEDPTELQGQLIELAEQIGQPEAVPSLAMIEAWIGQAKGKSGPDSLAAKFEEIDYEFPFPKIISITPDKVPTQHRGLLLKIKCSEIFLPHYRVLISEKGKTGAEELERAIPVEVYVPPKFFKSPKTLVVWIRDPQTKKESNKKELKVIPAPAKGIPKITTIKPEPLKVCDVMVVNGHNFQQGARVYFYELKPTEPLSSIDTKVHYAYVVTPHSYKPTELRIRLPDTLSPKIFMPTVANSKVVVSVVNGNQRESNRIVLKRAPAVVPNITSVTGKLKPGELITILGTRFQMGVVVEMKYCGRKLTGFNYVKEQAAPNKLVLRINSELLEQAALALDDWSVKHPGWPMPKAVSLTVLNPCQVKSSPRQIPIEKLKVRFTGFTCIDQNEAFSDEPYLIFLIINGRDSSGGWSYGIGSRGVHSGVEEGDTFSDNFSIFDFSIFGLPRKESTIMAIGMEEDIGFPGKSASMGIVKMYSSDILYKYEIPANKPLPKSWGEILFEITRAVAKQLDQDRWALLNEDDLIGIHFLEDISNLSGDTTLTLFKDGTYKLYLRAEWTP